MSITRPKGLTMTGSDWLRLLLLSVLWGGTFFFAKIALAAMPPMTLVFGRVLLAALALFVTLRLSGIAIPAARPVWVAFFGMGILNNVLPFSLIFWGQHALPPSLAASLAAILNATTPIFAVVTAHFLTRDEKLSFRKLAGVLVGFAGVAIMLAPNVQALAAGTLPRGDGRLLAGVGACLLGALIYGFAGLYGRRFKAMGILPLQTAFGQLAASSLIMAPVAALADQPWRLPMPGLLPLAALLALALVSTALAYVLYFRILANAGATNLMLVTFLIPVTAILLSVLLLGEKLAAIHFLGMALIGISLAIIDGRLAGAAIVQINKLRSM